MSRPRLLRVFFDTDMRGRHEALIARAKEEKIEFSKLKPGDVLAFVNGKRDRIMALAVTDEKDSFGVLGYYRSPHGRIDPFAIRYIAEAFGGGKFDMTPAIRQALEERLRKAPVQSKAESGKSAA